MLKISLDNITLCLYSKEYSTLDRFHSIPLYSTITIIIMYTGTSLFALTRDFKPNVKYCFWYGRDTNAPTLNIA